MKAGKTLTQLAQEIDRQNDAKADYIASPEAIRMGLATTTEDKLVPHLQVAEAFDGPITSVAHRQLALHTGIPKRYYDRMLHEVPSLLAGNVNAWLQRSDASRMVRTLDGQARALLSNRYARIDNYDVMTAILPLLQQVDGLQVHSAEVTERRLYIKAVTSRVEGEIEKGDVVQAGVLITNSEVGFGAFTVTPLVYRLVCRNGMVINDAAKRRTHVGTAIEADGLADELPYGDDTIEAIDRAVMLRARDHVGHALSDAFLNGQVARMRKALGVKLPEPTKAVEVLQKAAWISSSEGEEVFRHLVEGSDLSMYGLANAVTRAAQDVDSYDRSTELEAVGSKILDLRPNADGVFTAV